MCTMQQYLVAREHRKEKRARKDRAGNVIAEAVGADAGEEGEALPERGNLISYCSLDYQRMFDMARWRMHMMRQSLKAELEDRSVFPLPDARLKLSDAQALVLPLEGRWRVSAF